MSGSDKDSGIKHRIDWGAILSAFIGTLLWATGDRTPMEALRNAMIIGALPFAMILGLMMIAMCKAMYVDSVLLKQEK